MKIKAIFQYLTGKPIPVEYEIPDDHIGPIPIVFPEPFDTSDYQVEIQVEEQ